MSKKSEDSALGVEVRLEKGCLSKAEVDALQGGGGLQEYAAERRCWVGRKVEETRQGEGQKLPESRDSWVLISYLNWMKFGTGRAGNGAVCALVGKGKLLRTFHTVSKLLRA